MNNLIARGERHQNATTLLTPLKDDELREEEIESMKNDIMSDILRKLAEKDKQHTVFDIPLDNGTTRVDLGSLEKSVKDIRAQVLTNTKRK